MVRGSRAEREQSGSHLQGRNSRAGLVVCRGRRRIGKSTLIEKFGKKRRFFEFYGLAPREGIGNEQQLRHFGQLMGTAFGLPAMHFDNWHEALSTLAGLTTKGEAIILLDEISWVASGDKDFASKLKGVWDTRFKKNNRLIGDRFAVPQVGRGSKDVLQVVTGLSHAFEGVELL